ncbi:MAG: fumarate hydratase [Thermodesulfobacteriaceae bacterium]|nr:fumarate hydratase [Thermodesulfobacteriaceae bacterium]
MKVISYEKVVEAVKRGYIEACLKLPEEVKEALREAYLKEEDLLAQAVLEVLIENAEIAEREGIPLCQDTGIPVVWVRKGEEVKVKDLEKAINEGLELACKEGYLRASVCEPLSRKNTQTNTPAVIHYEMLEGEVFELWIMPKGCGSENMSQVAMLSPSQGWKGIKEFVIETVKRAGPNPCPPLIIGVGIGGTLEKCASLAKKALFRKLGSFHFDKEIEKLEKELWMEVNALGIGPLGWGGRTTALAVHLELYPCHIASLPVAVNFQCHSARKVCLKLL